MVLPQKEFVEELRTEWKRLWIERIDDKVRAEGVAVDDYTSLFIDKGTVIHATRNFKALNFKDILEQHQVLNVERYIPPDPHVGGWNKFAKEKIAVDRNRKNERFAKSLVLEKSDKIQMKKNGRGWLHK